MKGEWEKVNDNYYRDVDYGGVTRGYDNEQDQTIETDKWFAWEPNVCHCLDCSHNEGLPKSFSTAHAAMLYLESRYEY